MSGEIDTREPRYKDRVQIKSGFYRGYYGNLKAEINSPGQPIEYVIVFSLEGENDTELQFKREQFVITRSSYEDWTLQKFNKE